ncbi:hypothetical protein ACP4OV_027898 [Aristida adscensionis]
MARQELPGVMELAEPPSPSIFLNLPPTPQVVQGGEDDGGGGDGELQVLSRLLMEDTSVDKLSSQYPDNHPMLLQAQQAYAQIISDAWTTCSDSSPLQMAAAAPCYSPDNIDTLASAVPSSPHDAHGDGLDDSVFSSHGTAPTDAVEASTVDVVSMAFFKGMEEASKFLPGGNGRGRKKRTDGENEAEADLGRSSKQMAVLPQMESEEETAAREMLEKLMLSDGCDASCLSVDAGDMREQLCVGVEMENPQIRRHEVLGLHMMLIRCAEAVATSDCHGAADLLQKIRDLSSPTGDGTQRLAHCFAEGLEARLSGTGSQRFRSFMTKRTTDAGELKAYQLYMGDIGFFSMTYHFSNQTIYNAVMGRKKLHIVQYGLACWFQWPELLRRLARREGGPPEVRLTGIDTPQPGFRPAHLVEEAGRRLSDCARQFGVPFKFHGIVAKSEDVRAEDLGIDPSEVLVINNILNFDTLLDDSVIVDRPNPRDMVLSNIRKMRPKVFIHVVNNGSSNTAYFLTRFRENLFYFSTLFDMMDTIMPRDSCERLVLEQGAFARNATNIIACEGADRVNRPESYKKWQERNQRAGLRQLPLDPDIVQMFQDKLKDRHFLIDKDDQWLLTGWKGRVIYSISTWMADDD